MALVIPPGFAEASIEMRHVNDPEPWYVTFGVDLDGAGGDFVLAAENILIWWGATIGIQLSTSVTSTACRLRVGQDGGPPLIVQALGTWPGLVNSPMLPQNCAALYDKQTALAGRRGRGRFFVPGILKEGEVTETGTIASAARNDLQAQATAFLTLLNEGEEGIGDPTPMVVLHNAGVNLPPPTPVTAMQVQQTISTQRRRLR